MQIHHDIEHLPGFKRGVITFGSFDGMHLGHLQLIDKMKSIALKKKGEVVVVTFHPHPRRVIYPSDKSLRILSTKEEKIELFKNVGIDHLVFCPFTIEFSQWHPDEYISKFIIQKFKPKFIVIGYDHRFGLGRAGNIDYLKASSHAGEFEVIEIEKQMVDRILISSTRIRNYLLESNIQTANKLLGHPYIMTGKVVQGHRIGEKLGYPTANLELPDALKLIPPEGIYACYVIVFGQRYGGMLYIGKRPTVSSQGKRSIEINIFDFNEDIYGESIQVEVLKYMRPDATFTNIEGLKAQLDLDKSSVLLALDEFEQEKRLETAIIILNYNGIHHLKRFLPSVIQYSQRKQNQIFVADNGSSDESVAWVEEQFPEVKIISLDHNYGFAGGYNRALQRINAKFYFLLNSDVEVTENWMSPLYVALQNDDTLGACQPKIKSYQHKDMFEYAGAAGGLLDIFGYPFCRGRILSEVEKDTGQYDQEREVFWVTGAALCIRSTAFSEFQGFDADFFAHMEEIDLCWRMKQAGYKMKVIPSSIVYHQGGGTLSYLSPRKTYLNFRNGLSLLIKNEKGLKLLWFLPFRIVLDIIAGLRFLMVGEFDNAKSVVNALVSNGYHLASNYKKRKTALRTIRRHRIAPPNLSTGRYNGSIIWAYFIQRKRKYIDLRKTTS